MRKKNIIRTLAFLIYCFTVFLKTPLFKKIQTQYQLTESGSFEKVEVATDSAFTEKQTLIEKGKQILGKEETILEEDAFAKWAVLENFAVGYRLVYPAGFNINYEYGKVELTPPSGPGKIIVYIKEKTFEVKIISLENFSKEQRNLLEAAAQLVKDSFEFIDSSGYNLEEAKERFETKD